MSGWLVEEWTDKGGGSDPPQYIAPLHLHHGDDEAWCVLEGELTVRLGDRDVSLRAGDGVMALRGTPHTYWNPRPEPARYLLVMSPRIRTLIAALHMPGADDIAEVFAAHDSEFLGWP
jgi:mannose-6-phosphate isomerase-like protein (cupin superfamily)